MWEKLSHPVRMIITRAMKEEMYLRFRDAVVLAAFILFHPQLKTQVHAIQASL